MAAANTDSVNFPAAVCYNQGYTLENPAGFTGLVSVQLKQGLLHVEYVHRFLTARAHLLTGPSFDCMYMSKANAFFTEGDGGFQNVSIYTSSPEICKMVILIWF